MPLKSGKGLPQVTTISENFAAYHTEEDHAGTRAAQRLVGGGSDDVAVLKGLRRLLCCHQATAPRTLSSPTTPAA